MNHLNIHLNQLEKAQMKPNVSKRKEMKIRIEINEIETRKTMVMFNETMSCFLERGTKLTNL